MQQLLILYPVFALVGLTSLVWITMILRRVHYFQKNKIDAEGVKSRTQFNQVFGDYDQAGNNFMNLFELPVLFYTLCIVALLIQHVTFSLLVLAWVYVGLRMIHSFIHCTYNNVSQRAMVWAISSVVLWAAWICFGWTVFRSGL